MATASRRNPSGGVFLATVVELGKGCAGVTGGNERLGLVGASECSVLLMGSTKLQVASTARGVVSTREALETPGRVGLQVAQTASGVANTNRALGTLWDTGF